MRRQLLRSTAFVRATRRLLKKDPALAEELYSALKLLKEDAFDPQLRSHKLKGRLAGSWACSAGYDIRIVFDLVKWEGEEAILLQAVGSHEEVY